MDREGLYFRSDRRLHVQGCCRIPLVEQLFNGITPFSSGGTARATFALMQTGSMPVRPARFLNEVCGLPIDDRHQLYYCIGHRVSGDSG